MQGNFTEFNIDSARKNEVTKSIQSSIMASVKHQSPHASVLSENEVSIAAKRNRNYLPPEIIINIRDSIVTEKWSGRSDIKPTAKMIAASKRILTEEIRAHICQNMEKSLIEEFDRVPWKINFIAGSIIASFDLPTPVAHLFVQTIDVVQVANEYEVLAKELSSQKALGKDVFVILSGLTNVKMGHMKLSEEFVGDVFDPHGLHLMIKEGCVGCLLIVVSIISMWRLLSIISMWHLLILSANKVAKIKALLKKLAEDEELDDEEDFCTMSDEVFDDILKKEKYDFSTGVQMRMEAERKSRIQVKAEAEARVSFSYLFSYSPSFFFFVKFVSTLT